MSSGLIKFLKALIKALGETGVGAIVAQHAIDNRLSVQQHRDLVDELEQVGISVEQPIDAAGQRAIDVENGVVVEPAPKPAPVEVTIVEPGSQHVDKLVDVPQEVVVAPAPANKVPWFKK